jgi:hypothetical protein
MSQFFNLANADYVTFNGSTIYQVKLNGTAIWNVGMAASEYYGTSSAGSYLVYPNNGVRISDSKTYGSYQTYNNYSNYARPYSLMSCSNGTLHGYSTYNGWQGNTANWTGGTTSTCNRIYWWAQSGCSGGYTPSCFSTATGWH